MSRPMKCSSPRPRARRSTRDSTSARLPKCFKPTCSSMPTETNASYSPLDVAIVVVDELDVRGEPFARRPLARVGDLLARDVERLHTDAVAARHMERQRPPAASRLDHGLARLQPELPADQVELGALRLLERDVGMLEIRAGVDHLVVEPRPVEVVAEVVVVVDVPARTGLVVGHRQRRRDALDRRRQQAQSRHRLDDALEAAADVEAAGHVGLAEIQMRVDEQAEDDTRVADDERTGLPVQVRHTPSCRRRARRVRRRRRCAPEGYRPATVGLRLRESP